MTKIISFILLTFSTYFSFGQDHSGIYNGVVEKDTIGKIEITLELKKDSTYEITAQFDYYGVNEGHCFDGQTWKYYGKWLSYEEYIFFKPCVANYEQVTDSTFKCSECCEFPNDDFDFWETLREPFKTEREKKKFYKKKFKINQPFRELGYNDRLEVKTETKEIFFHFGWDCHEQIWVDHPIKKIE